MAKSKTGLWRVTHVTTKVEERMILRTYPVPEAIETPATADELIQRCGRVARAKGLPTTITPEEVRSAA